jgi:hypothetical protein
MMNAIKSYLAKAEAGFEYADISVLRALIGFVCLGWGIQLVWPGDLLATVPAWRAMIKIVGDEQALSIWPFAGAVIGLIADIAGSKRLRAVGSMAAFSWWLFVLTTLLVGQGYSTGLGVYVPIALFSGWVLYRDSIQLWQKPH